MHAIGNLILARDPSAKVAYVHSERFVSDMVRGLQHNTIAEFKRTYRSLDALLIDDIQFFAGKDRSQEEFFHTFNALLEGQRQIILTCDRYPKEVTGLEERLKSRFGWGLTVCDRAAGARDERRDPDEQGSRRGRDVAAKRSRFSSRSGSARTCASSKAHCGACSRTLASPASRSRWSSRRKRLRDVLALQDKLVTVENIQKTVAEYFKIRVADLLSKRRSRSIARPRQIAMALAKELTTHSLPEIGDALRRTRPHDCPARVPASESAA